MSKFNNDMKAKFYLFPLIMMLMIIIACGSSDNKIDASDLVNNPSSADNIVSESDMPLFQFNEDVHDFGKITQGEVVSFSFKFINAGKTDLLISSAKATCGCTVADYPKTPIKPGAEGSITVTFDSESKIGIQNKAVTIVANTKPNTKVLTIKSEVVKPEE